MKQRTKKIIYISTGLLATLAIAVWYFYPVLAHWYLIPQSEDIQKHMKVVPKYIETLSSAPTNWTDINIDKLSLKLPIYRFNKISGNESHILFNSESGSILISNIIPPEETLGSKSANSFTERLSILKSTPKDISAFNSRSENERSSAYQLMKFIGIPIGGLGEVRVVNSSSRKVICTISEKREAGINASIDVYSPNEAVFVSILLLRYKDKQDLDTDVQQLISSIHVPDQPLDQAAVKIDIDFIINKYNKKDLTYSSSRPRRCRAA